MTELLQGVTWTGLVMRCIHPMIQILFQKNDVVFQDYNAPIHTAGIVQSLFEGHEAELQHFLWLAQSPDLNSIEPLWSVLDSRVTNRFPSPIFLKGLEDVLQ
jgi:hypothetical protein